MHESLQCELMHSCNSLTLKATLYYGKRRVEVFSEPFLDFRENLLSSSADGGRSARRFEHALHTIYLASDMSKAEISKH